MIKRLARFFWWLHPNTFSTDGTAVVLIDRFTLRYREGGRSLLIAQDLQADPHLVAIERASIREWEPPHEREPLSEAQVDTIIANVRRALESQHYRLTLLDGDVTSYSRSRDIARR